MNKAQKRKRTKLLISGSMLLLLILLEKSGILPIDLENEIGKVPAKFLNLIPYLIPYLLVGIPVLQKAFRNIIKGHVFDENFLMMIATFGAFAVSENVEAVAVMVFYRVGTLFEEYALGRTRKSIKEMMKLLPDVAHVFRKDSRETVDPSELEIGDIIEILPGEKVPVDSELSEGASYLDTSSLTGESVPRSVHPGDLLISGCINQEGTLKAKVLKKYEDSSVSRILDLVANATSKKAKVENFITRFARIYTPVVTIGALLLAFVPPLFFNVPWGEGIRRACIFLVISCPCALVVSIPLGFFSGMGAASKSGVMVKGSNYLELLAKAKTFVFDKTGTLTEGNFKVRKVTGEETLSLAYELEKHSNHPIAKAIVKAWEEKRTLPEEKEEIRIQEIPGKGLLGKGEGVVIHVGNKMLMDENNIQITERFETGTVIYVAKNQKFVGSIVISDSIKKGMKDTLTELRKSGIEKMIMLSGDRREQAEAIGNELGLDEIHAELLPENKVAELEKVMSSTDRGNITAFIGDGMNDAPGLMRADLGIAMGALGSDAAIEAADIVILDDDIQKISKTKRIAQKTLRIVRENIIISLLFKFLVLILGIFGLAPMGLAIFADVGVLVLAILNSMRAYKI